MDRIRHVGLIGERLATLMCLKIVEKRHSFEWCGEVARIRAASRRSPGAGKIFKEPRMQYERRL
jgi:hypothetical protein